MRFMVEWTGEKVLNPVRTRFPKLQLGREITVSNSQYLVYAILDRGDGIQRARAVQFRLPENRAIITQ